MFSSELMLSLVGYAMIFCIIALLLKGKVTPIVVLVVVPFVAALVLGHSPTAIADFIKGGVSTTTNTAILLFFSVIFFGIMSDVGVFDGLVEWLLRIAGNNVILITVVSSIVAIVGHLDGATATTVLITIPTLYPIYARMGIRPHVLLCITGAAMGVMNLVPWGGPTARVATVIKMDATELWHILIPMQVMGILVTIGLAVVLGMIEKKRISGLIAAGEKVGVEHHAIETAAEKENPHLRPKLIWANAFITVAVILTLVFDLMTSYVVFLLGLSVALMLNFRSLKEQDARIKAHAPSAFIIGATMIAAGAMVGILDKTGMMKAMGESLVAVVPAALGSYMHIIIGFLGLPIGTVIGADAYYYGIFPLVAEVASQYGVTPLSTGLAMLIGKNVGMLVSPLVPATYLAIGLVNIDLKEHLRFSFPWLYGVSIMTLIGAIIIGVIPL